MKFLLKFILKISLVWLHIFSVSYANSVALQCEGLLSSEPSVESSSKKAAKKEEKEKKKSKSGEKSRDQVPKSEVKQINFKELTIPENILDQGEIQRWAHSILKLELQTQYRLIDKNVIYLGRVLPDGSILQFEYFLRDAVRSDETPLLGADESSIPKYILVGIRFIPSNNARSYDKKGPQAYTLVVKKPLAEGSLKLKENLSVKLFVQDQALSLTPFKEKAKTESPEGTPEGSGSVDNFEGLANPANDLTRTLQVDVIPVLSGPVLEQFLKVREASLYLSRKATHELLAQHGPQRAQGEILVRYKTHKLMANIWERTWKKAFGFLIMAGVVVSVYYFPQYYRSMVESSYVSVPSQNVTSTDYSQFGYISAVSTPAWASSRVFEKAKESIQFSSAVTSKAAVKNGIELFSQLSGKEDKSSNGKTRVFTFNDAFQFMGKMNSDLASSLMAKRPESAENGDSFYLVSTFKKTEKIFLSKLYYQQSQFAPYWISYITVEKEKDPELYAGLLELIKVRSRETHDFVPIDEGSAEEGSVDSTSNGIGELFQRFSPLGVAGQALGGPEKP